MELQHNPDNPASDLTVVMQNNCNLILYLNFSTIFSLAAQISSAVLKEDIETSYYKDFANAALNKIEQYIQLENFMIVYYFNYNREMKLFLLKDNM